MSSDFDVAIARSKLLVDDFDDIDPTPAPRKGLWHGAEIRMRGNLNAHESLFYLTIGAAVWHQARHGASIACIFDHYRSVDDDTRACASSISPAVRC